MLLIMILVYFTMDCINLFIYRLNYMFHSINHESHEQRVLLIQYQQKINAFFTGNFMAPYLHQNFFGCYLGKNCIMVQFLHHVLKKLSWNCTFYWTNLVRNISTKV